MIVVVMGVTGCGKSTVGALLARRLGCEFLDGDDFHPPANVEKMRAGTPLSDADRLPWLELLNAKLREKPAAVLACSALKKSYRDVLSRGIADFHLAHLQGEIELIRARLASRQHRYMPPSLLESQFATLEPPREAIAVDIGQSPEDCVAAIVGGLSGKAP